MAHTCSLLVLCFIFLRVIQGEVVHITVVAFRHTDVVYTMTGFQPRFQCYRSDPDTDAVLSFGRSAAITSLRKPPPALPHSRNPNIMEVLFPEGGGWDRDGYGPFYCQASKAGRDVTNVTTFFQRRDAKFTPQNGLFTQTVNVNDTGVEIRFAVWYPPNIAKNRINWRKNGKSAITAYEGLTSLAFPGPIQTSDAGIYDVNYAYERNQGWGGMHRLIVRGCEADKWGPPECRGVCDKCYNGGVCDDKSGLCICPNNFRGPNCLEICRPGGGNRFGLNCEFRCTDNRRDSPIACHEKLFCLPDPYGCSCDVGVRGYACNIGCLEDRYGPGCSQECHCSGRFACDRYTGECPNGCREGWSGNNCQIPDVCDVGYYGPECTDKCHCMNDAPCGKVTGECPQLECATGFMVREGKRHCQECDDGSFGPECLPLCHCAADACDKTTGKCNGQCLHNWFEPDCITGISRLVPTMVNPYQSSTFICYVEGAPHPEESSVQLYRVDANTYNSTGIYRRQNASFVSGIERGVVFDVESVHPGHTYVCNVSAATQDPAHFFVNDTTYVLPVMDGSVPLVSNPLSSEVHLQWIAWSEVKNLGDSPLAGYDIFKKAEGDWVKAMRVDQLTTSATVRGLNPDTDYMFSVAAVRAGPGGTGPLSASAQAVTLCEKPSASPTGVQITAKNLTEIEVTWEPISNISSECRSGVTHYVIYYITLGSTSSNSVRVYNATSYTLTGLDEHKDYTIQITAANKDEESNLSIAVVRKALIPEDSTTDTPTDESLPIPVLAGIIAGSLVFMFALILGLVLGCQRTRGQKNLNDNQGTSSEVTLEKDSPLEMLPAYIGLNEHIYSDIPGTHSPETQTNPPVPSRSIGEKPAQVSQKNKAARAGKNSTNPRNKSVVTGKKSTNAEKKKVPSAGDSTQLLDPKLEQYAYAYAESGKLTPITGTNHPDPGTKMGEKPDHPGKEAGYLEPSVSGTKPAHSTDLDPAMEPYAYAYPDIAEELKFVLGSKNASDPGTYQPIRGQNSPIARENSPTPGTNTPTPDTKIGKKPNHSGKKSGLAGNRPTHVGKRPDDKHAQVGSAHDRTEKPEQEDYVNKAAIRTSNALIGKKPSNPGKKPTSTTGK